MQTWWLEFKADFIVNFIDRARWRYLANGLLTTLQITLLAAVIGIAIGTILAVIRASYDKNSMQSSSGIGYHAMRVANGVAKIYITVIRGTPVVVQLMIMYYIIFASSRNGVRIATLAFGINSGAYVAEIIRGGIMAIDDGQFEAGRSLGLSHASTMLHIAIPQALRSVLPSLVNEFIALLKETSVAGYVAVKDLTKGGDIIRGVTYSAFMPLLAVAIIYLALVMLFTRLSGFLEKRYRRNG
jgi:His/Glu/Gln/Arg/opine family amino acid ABC transporter permease subunit